MHISLQKGMFILPPLVSLFGWLLLGIGRLNKAKKNVDYVVKQCDSIFVPAISTGNLIL